MLLGTMKEEIGKYDDMAIESSSCKNKLWHIKKKTEPLPFQSS